MTSALIDYWLFIACLGAVLALLAGTVAAVWDQIRKRRK